MGEWIKKLIEQRKSKMEETQFLTWAYRMWGMNREERLNFKNEQISYDEYFKSNEQWLKLKYEELKQMEKK